MPVAAAVVAAGAVVGAVGAEEKGASEQSAANYNANIAYTQAAQAKQEATENARRQRVSSEMQLGNMRAQYGASGVQMEGSALDVMQASASRAELDAQTIIHQGDMKAWAYQSNASMETFKGVQAAKEADFSAAGSLIGGGGKAASMMA